MKRFVNNPSLNVAAIGVAGKQPTDTYLDAVRSFLDPDDSLTILSPADDASACRADIAFMCGVCGSTPLSETVTAAGMPVLAIEPYRGFHPYHAAFYHDVRARGGRVLSAWSTEDIAASVRAVRAARALRDTRLIVAHAPGELYRAEEIRPFASAARKRLGIEIVITTTDDIKALARDVSDADADGELARWERDIIEGSGEMSRNYLRQTARLYVAHRRLLDDHDAAGITTSDIKGFLIDSKGEVMPNVAYGPLVFDGFLACEEGDIEVLVTELLLYAATGSHPTMSNIYFSYRDRFDALPDAGGYTPDMERDDCRQCFEDNHITAAHFSTSGVLPPGMMQEERYRVRETLPCWPGQGMISATPRLGPVWLARISNDVGTVHLEAGDADGLGAGDHYGWQRGRWFIRLPDTAAFARNCLHQHYAIGPRQDEWRTIRSLIRDVLRMEVRGSDAHQSPPG